MIMIDKLAYSSKLRFSSPFLKSFFAVATLLICVCSSSYITSLFVLAMMGGCAVYYGTVSFAYYMKLMLIPAVFLLLSTVTIILNVSKMPFDLWAVPIGDYYLTCSKEAMSMALHLILRAFACVSCLYFLALTTPMVDLMEVLRRLKVPGVLIELMMLIYRFIFILLEAAGFILTSQKCRLGHKDAGTSIRSTGKMLAVLLVRAYQKADRLYDAMEARGYDGTIRVLYVTQRATKKQVAVVVILEIGLVIVSFLSDYAF